MQDEVSFYRQLCLARFVEAVVGSVLEIAGYVVFPLGYEQFMPVLRHLFRGNQAGPVPTEERLRSAPDLLVVGQTGENKDVIPHLVEVKYRSWENPTDVRLRGISQYRRHWPEALLVVVIPGGDVFYAQQISRLNTRRRVFDLTSQFQRLDTFFPQVSQNTLEVFGEDVKRFAAAAEIKRG